MHNEITLEFKELRRRKKDKEAMRLKDNEGGSKLTHDANCNNILN